MLYVYICMLWNLCDELFKQLSHICECGGYCASEVTTKDIGEINMQ